MMGKSIWNEKTGLGVFLAPLGFKGFYYGLFDRLYFAVPAGFPSLIPSTS